MPKIKLLSWLPNLNHQVWILAAGRFLSQVGTGFTLFYAPIFFVNQIGLSSTQVGLSLASASISGVLGRILGGSFSDSKFWGRRRTLLLSTTICALGSLVIAASSNFATLVVGNLLMGLGIGLYWPATEAVVADLTSGEQRREAYAITRLADNLGLGLGIIFGGLLISITGAYRLLFIMDAISFILFSVVIYIAIAESYQAEEHNEQTLGSWVLVLQDKTLQVYVLANIIFTTYISQMHSTMPLFFKNFVLLEDTGKGFPETTISALFTCHLVTSILFQLPISRALKKFSHPRSLIISALMWGIGFIFIGMIGVATSNQLLWAIAAMVLLAIATVSYTPTAASLVTELAPESQRGIYFSIDSLCWAAGYFIGPTLGGWALDQPRAIANNFWLCLALSVTITIVILQYFGQIWAKESLRLEGTNSIKKN